MSQPESRALKFYDKHEASLRDARQACLERRYFTLFPETPDRHRGGAAAEAAGAAAFRAQLGRPFELDQPGTVGRLAGEVSPYTQAPLGIDYPRADPDALFAAARAAMRDWAAATPRARLGVCMEIVDRLYEGVFETAQAVMHTAGQSGPMSYAGSGTNALDRGVEALAYAFAAMSEVPAEAQWERRFGSSTIRLHKRYRLVPRGVAVCFACATFPTWNAYPAMLASLATGNPVIVKPHPNAILPAAISVRIVREVLRENGIDPDLLTLAVTDDPGVTQALATDPAVKSIDFTGSNTIGRWLAEHARQAQVYAELAGVNNIVIESTDRYQAMLKNLAFTLSLYSGQMCTTTQDFFVPAGGIETDEGHKSFEQVAADLAAAVDRFLADPAVATAVLGAIQSPDTVRRIEAAPALGEVVLASRRLEHPEFPAATVRTPLLLSTDAGNEQAFLQERFGPISFLVKVRDWQAAVALSERAVK
jgi:phenylacetic acid degradation protein paaN